MRTTLSLLLLFFLAAIGCGGDDALNSPTAKKLTTLATMFMDYTVAKTGGAPANEDQFKQHIRSVPDFVLQDRGIDPKNVDVLFKSERDQEPFVVIYGKGLTEISGNSKQVIAHEKTGVNGKKLVVFGSTKVALVSETELEQLKAGK